MFHSLRRLANEEELAIFRECPKFIGNDEFELIDVIAYLLHLRSYGVVVGDCLKMLVLDAVGNAASLNELFYSVLNNLCTLGYLRDDFLVARGEFLGSLVREDVEHALHVLSQTTLIVGADGDYMVHRKIAEDACLNLYLLLISLPYHLINKKKNYNCKYFLTI